MDALQSCVATLRRVAAAQEPDAAQLADAAAAMLRAPLLGLLSAAQLADAAGALAACLASGCGSAAALVALHAVLGACPEDSARTVAAGAVAKAGGLLPLAIAAADGQAGAHEALQLVLAAAWDPRDACGAALEAGGAAALCRKLASSPQPERDVLTRTLLQLAAAAEPRRATRAVVQALQDGGALRTSFLQAAEGLQTSLPTPLRGVLMQAVAGLLAGGALTVPDLRKHAPKLCDAAIEVVAAEQRADAELHGAAAILLAAVLRWATEQADSSEWAAWLQPQRVAEALLQRGMRSGWSTAEAVALAAALRVLKPEELRSLRWVRRVQSA